ncbi:MAG TPA: low specificity L-threonine aldolase [Rhizobiales bacterium]|nr:low specificity L-threonine aldolase [Hyphomicrobiales bacterium]
MNFASDNVDGVHEAIIEAICRANAGAASPYGADDITRRVERRFDEIFERRVRVFLVTTGTAANALCLSTLTPPYGAVFAHSHAHVMVDECGAPEFYTGGAKMIGLEGAGGKITPNMVRDEIAGFIRAEHDPKPAAITITQSTELGSVYSCDEITAFGDLARERGLKLHMDGARFANALVSLGCSPAQMSWKSGVDALSFGITKNGAMGVDAVVFFDPELARDFEYRRMRSGQLLSKGRFLAAQVEAYLENDLWLENAAHANRQARILAERLEKLAHISLALPCEANAVFAFMPRSMFEKLQAGGANFHDWIASDTDVEPAGAGKVMVRLVTSFATSDQDVDRFLALAKTCEKF